MRPDDLLDGQHPGSPSVLVNANTLQIFDLDFMERPVRRNLQLYFQLMLIDQVGSHDLIHSASHFYCHIFVNQQGGGFRALHMRQFCSDDDRRKVL